MIELVLNNSPIFEQTGYPFQVVLKADAPVGIVFVSCFALHTYENIFSVLAEQARTWLFNSLVFNLS